MKILKIYLKNWYLLVTLFISIYFIFFDDLNTGLWGIGFFLLLSARLFYFIHKRKGQDIPFN
jgi:hypothetical protein